MGKLPAECERLGVPWDDRWMSALTAHYTLLKRWAPKVNLISVGDLPHAVNRHILDSLSLLALEPVREATGRLIDVGSGAGFPGIPLAAALPDVDCTLLEPRKKRGVFITQAIVAAGLKNARWMSGRLPDDTLAGRFDLVISRATFAPPELLARVAPLLAPGGTAAIMSASAPDLSELEGWELVADHRFTIDDRDRYVAAFKPTS
ncbi:MAG: 16S rRNA (guanine527-N7)-methyltransferase [Myxococcota bacterium]|jgi:16S rRNA (guanine527-N7)-methyltransferase